MATLVYQRVTSVRKLHAQLLATPPWGWPGVIHGFQMLSRDFNLHEKLLSWHVEPLESWYSCQVTHLLQVWF